MNNQELRDNQMQRSLTQALYKYLPLTWIDFYNKDERSTNTAFIKYWNSRKLEDINQRRLLMKVAQNVSEFEAIGSVKDFIFPVDEENYDVLTPVPGKNADIIAEISPLTFFCGKCRKVHFYKSYTDLQKRNPNRKCTVKTCSATIKQIGLVYVCTCGWAGPIEPISKCKEHGINRLYYTGEFKYYCDCRKDRLFEVQRICPECNKMLRTKNALDMGNQIPLTLSMIDLLDKKLDNFLANNDDGMKVVLGYWLEKISKEQLTRLIKSRANTLTEVETEAKIKHLVSTYLGMGFSEEQSKTIAMATIQAESQEGEVTTALNFIKEAIHVPTDAAINHLAVQLLEYDAVLHPSSGSISTLKDAMEVSKKLNTNAQPEVYEETARKYGFKWVQACENIPFIMSSYGFTRKETEPKKATLVGFPNETNKKRNVYATKLNTEGILFELDRVRIIQWLLRNGLINEFRDNVPEDLTNESEVKAWFLNKVETRAIPTFSPIEESLYPITYYVYNLVHSVSHALLRQAANLCGLDKNSLSEYIFPNVPAFMIYCQNSQGINIGALSNLFEAYFDKWLNSTFDSIEKCIFDPVCIDRDHACSGCLYLNEVSCVHFNKDLDRRYLVGWFDKGEQDRIYGFWEGI